MEAEAKTPPKNKEPKNSRENTPEKPDKKELENKEAEKSDNAVTSPVHDDSDFEDNIVVTVPSASETRTEKYLSRSRHSSSNRSSGHDQSSPKGKHASAQQVRKHSCS